MKPVKKESFYVYGAVDGKFKKYFQWNGKLRYVPLGYRQHDLDAEANATLSVYFKEHPVSLTGRFSYSLHELPTGARRFPLTISYGTTPFGRRMRPVLR